MRIHPNAYYYLTSTKAPYYESSEGFFVGVKRTKRKGHNGDLR